MTSPPNLYDAQSRVADIVDALKLTGFTVEPSVYGHGPQESWDYDGLMENIQMVINKGWASATKEGQR